MVEYNPGNILSMVRVLAEFTKSYEGNMRDGNFNAAGDYKLLIESTVGDLRSLARSNNGVLRNRIVEMVQNHNIRMDAYQETFGGQEE